MAMDYPDAKDWSLYYAQSVSLTRFLVERAAPEQFIQFVQNSQRDGIESALRGTYGIAGLAELQERWTEYARQQVAPIQEASREPACSAVAQPRSSDSARTRPSPAPTIPSTNQVDREVPDSARPHDPGQPDDREIADHAREDRAGDRRRDAVRRQAGRVDMPHLPHGRAQDRRHGDQQAEADGPGSRQTQAPARPRSSARSG